MSFNFHTHTVRCNHASGADEEYVLCAIQNGYTVMGFSDHAPYAFPNGHKSGYRISLEDTQDYVSSVRALQEKYKAERAIIEYNGMWMEQTLFNAMPESWLIYQEMCFVDATTFKSF